MQYIFICNYLTSDKRFASDRIEKKLHYLFNVCYSKKKTTKIGNTFIFVLIIEYVHLKSKIDFTPYLYRGENVTSKRSKRKRNKTRTRNGIIIGKNHYWCHCVLLLLIFSLPLLLIFAAKLVFTNYNLIFFLKNGIFSSSFVVKTI